MKKFILEAYKSKFVMHCDEEYKADIFCNLLYLNRRTWVFGVSYLNNSNFQSFKKETCYNFNTGHIGETQFYKKEGYTILEFDDFVWIDAFDSKIEALESVYKKGAKVYISGPMTGFEEFNYPLFNSIESRLTKKGIKVCNPAKIKNQDLNKWKECMKKDLHKMLTCDYVFLLPGWECSKGASIEKKLADDLGFVII